MQTLANHRPEIATTNPGATNTNAANMVKAPKIWQSMPNLIARSPVSGRSRSKRTIQAHPAWTAYLIVRARFMAPQKNHPVIPTEIVGFFNRLAN